MTNSWNYVMRHYCRWTDQYLVGNTPIIGAISTNSWRVSKFWQYLQTLYRTTILEFNRFLTDFGYELSNNKCEQLLPSSIIGSWRFFRARVDQLHVSNNASHIFFSAVTSADEQTISTLYLLLVYLSFILVRLNCAYP
jgi:hypothetical protein